MADNVMKKILIVEDDTAVRESIKRLLLIGGEFIVSEAFDGQDALEKIAVDIPDLIVLDINMPRKDGYEVCLKLKQGQATAGVKIIVITAFSPTIERPIVKALGADYFFEKPFDIMLFKAKIKELLHVKSG